MVEPLGHRQTKEAATRMPDLTSPRHIPTLPMSEGAYLQHDCLKWGIFAHTPRGQRPAAERRLRSFGKLRHSAAAHRNRSFIFL